MSDWELKPHPSIDGVPGPVMVCVMDGVGRGVGDAGDAVALAKTPTLDMLARTTPTALLRAHGTAVGMPTDADMGNSEVGHNALGAGRTFDQGAKLVDHAIETGALFEGEVWQSLMKRCAGGGGTLHLLGLLSDGNVHSHIRHLLSLLSRSSEAGVARVRVHVLLDGRDVPESSALIYVEQLEQALAEINGASGRDYRIASGGGRMTTTMDRYGADWSMVQRGWAVHVHGEGRGYPSTTDAIEALRTEGSSSGSGSGVIDQYLPSFVITDDDGAPVGAMRDGDAAVLFNFRGDRAIEISTAFEADEFSHFDRGRRPDVLFAGMMEYDGDLHVPRNYLVTPPLIERTLGEYLVRNRVPQLATSETQKFGHVTYFWNGNRSGAFDEQLERYVEIPSDTIPFDQRPQMKAQEITDVVLASLEAGDARFGRFNYANGDMVGHTGKLQAAIEAVQVVDRQLARLLPAIEAQRGALIVTADHGNADEMYERDGKSGELQRDARGGLRPKTSHTLNRVPLHIYAPSASLRIDDRIVAPSLSNVAATSLQLLGLRAPEGFEPGLLGD